jgi:hypothetical protein
VAARSFASSTAPTPSVRALMVKSLLRMEKLAKVGSFFSQSRFCAKKFALFSDYDSFLMFSRVTRIDSIHMFDEFNPNAPFQSIKSTEFIRNAIGITFDYKRQTIFYSDIQKSSINSVFFNGSSHRVILDSELLLIN